MNKSLSQLWLAGGLLVCAGSALAANKVDYVDIAKGDGIHINDAKVFIKPINGNYGQATQTTATFHIKMRAGCKRQNVVKGAFVSYGSENVSKDVLEYSDNYKVNAGARGGKTMSWAQVEMKVPLQGLGFNPAAMCQSYMQNKMSQGVSKQQVLASDHVLKRQVLFTGVGTCGKPGKSGDQYGADTYSAEMEIVCKSGSAGGINDIKTQAPKPPSGPGAFQAQMQVTNVSLTATPYKVSTTCPTKAKFSGTITASGPGEVKYRVLFPGSVTTGIRTINFVKAGTVNVGTLEYPTMTSIPYAAATLEIISPGNKKAHTNFIVQCIQGGVGGTNIQQQQGPAPKPGNIAPPPAPIKIDKIQSR